MILESPKTKAEKKKEAEMAIELTKKMNALRKEKEEEEKKKSLKTGDRVRILRGEFRGECALVIEPKWRDKGVQIELLGSQNSDRDAITVLPSEIQKLKTDEDMSEDTEQSSRDALRRYLHTAVVLDLPMILGVQTCTLFLFDEKDRNVLRSILPRHSTTTTTSASSQISISLNQERGGIVGHVARTGLKEVVTSIRDDPRYVSSVDLWAWREEKKKVGALYVPVRSSDNRTKGVLQVLASSISPRHEILAELSAAYASHAVSAISSSAEMREVCNLSDLSYLSFFIVVSL